MTLNSNSKKRKIVKECEASSVSGRSSPTRQQQQQHPNPNKYIQHHSERISIDTIDGATVQPNEFYRRYIARRIPCIITNWNGKGACDLGQQIIQELLRKEQDTPGSKNNEYKYQKEMIQVERRDTLQERFGQSRYDASRQQQRQCEMSIPSFLLDVCNITHGNVEKCDNAVDEQYNEESMHYYLSTQEHPVSEDDKEKSQLKVQPPQPYYGSPCHILHQQGLLPADMQSKLTGNLVLSSVNMWMGYTPSYHPHSEDQKTFQQHSGLHFDYHDNFYYLLRGSKEFILYPPHCSPYLILSGGSIDKIHHNGVISFQKLPILADGRVILDDQETNDSDDDDLDIEDDDDDDDDDGEDEIVLGKGFDYKSSDDESDEKGNKLHVLDNFDDYHCNDDEDVEKDDGNGVDVPSLLPPNFSWIDPINSTKEQNVQTFPVYKQCIEPYRITLQSNQCFYLPASWLHCVVSSGTSVTTSETTTSIPVSSSYTSNTNDTGNHAMTMVIPSSVHMAVNYWYHPPDCLNDYNHPYVDQNYWEK